MEPSPEILLHQKEVRLLIVDDHQMVRDGFKAMLGTENKYFRFIVDEAENGEEAIKKILHHLFEIVVLDYHLPGINGAETAERILLYKPEIKIITLSNYDELSCVERMLQAGSKGYLLKNVEPYELINAIKTILAGEIYYSHEIAVKLIDTAKQKEPGNSNNMKGLTTREIEVLKLVCMELNNQEIADHLCLSKRTIDTHRQHLLLKLGVKNTVGLIKAAYKMKLVSE